MYFILFNPFDFLISCWFYFILKLSFFISLLHLHFSSLVLLDSSLEYSIRICLVSPLLFLVSLSDFPPSLYEFAVLSECLFSAFSLSSVLPPPLHSVSFPFNRPTFCGRHFTLLYLSLRSLLYPLVFSLFGILTFITVVFLPLCLVFLAECWASALQPFFSSWMVLYLRLHVRGLYFSLGNWSFFDLFPFWF